MPVVSATTGRDDVEAGERGGSGMKSDVGGGGEAIQGGRSQKTVEMQIVG